MWQSIAEVVGKYRNKKSMIVGTGPSADKFDNIALDDEMVYIGLNRAICLYNNFEFVFVDAGATLQVVLPYLSHTKYIVMPIWSREQLNINHPTVRQCQEKILFCSWVYEDFAFLRAVPYSLNDFLLFISWGILQPAIHFASKIGIKDITLLGCDGGPVNGKPCSSRIAEVFKTVPNAKQSKEHKKTLSRIPRGQQ